MRLPCREQDASSERISVACAVSGLNNLRRLRAFPASLRAGGAGVTNYSMLSSSSIITR